MASRYPARHVMIARLATILRIPAVTSTPHFPDDPTLRAHWDGSLQAYIRESDHKPCTCLDFYDGGIGIHTNGESGTAYEVIRETSAKGIAEAVWAWERIEGARVHINA